MGPLAKAESRLGQRLVLPAVIVILVLVLFPFLWNILLAGRRIRLIDLQSVSLFSGGYIFRNFSRVVGTTGFWEVVKTTIIYSVFGTGLSIGLGLWAAMTMKETFKGRSIIRGFMLFPYVAPVIAVTSVWRLLLNPTFGFTNEWQEQFGLGRVDYLGQREFTLPLGFTEVQFPLALSMVILFEAWRYFPFAYLFMLARLQAVPNELHEAALLDGATPTQSFRHIVWPQLKGVIAVLFLLRFIFTFNKFDDIFLLTGGAAGTDVVSTEVIDWLIGRADVGAAAALSLILAGMLAVFVAVYFFFFYEDESKV